MIKIGKFDFWKDKQDSCKTNKKFGIVFWYDMGHKADNIYICIDFLSKYYRFGFFINKKRGSFYSRLTTGYIKKVLHSDKN